jgi:hypothetical protein
LYAITNRRALVISANRSAHVREFGPEVVSSAQLKRRRGGGGDILLERRVEWGQDAQGRSTRKAINVGFYGVKDIEEVMAKLKQME